MAKARRVVRLLRTLHPVTFGRSSSVGPGFDARPWARQPGTALRMLRRVAGYQRYLLPPPLHPHAALVARICTHPDCSRESRYPERDETFTCRGPRLGVVISRERPVVACHLRATISHTFFAPGHSWTSCMTVSPWLSPPCRHLAQRALPPWHLVAPCK